MIREIHEILLSKGRGSTKLPGEFRRSQNWIGGSRPGNALYVPPPPGHVVDLMSDLEKFIHTDYPEYPTLVKVGLMHVQFESIHPFLDGNGRLGRLLITLTSKLKAEALSIAKKDLVITDDEYRASLDGDPTFGELEPWDGENPMMEFIDEEGEEQIDEASLILYGDHSNNT